MLALLRALVGGLPHVYVMGLIVGTELLEGPPIIIPVSAQVPWSGRVAL